MQGQVPGGTFGTSRDRKPKVTQLPTSTRQNAEFLKGSLHTHWASTFLYLSSAAMPSYRA